MPSSSAFLIRDSIEKQVEDLLARMTLQEKAGQLNQVLGFDDERRTLLRQGLVGSVLNLAQALPGSPPSAATMVEATNAIQRIAVNETRLGIPLLFGRDVIHGFRTVFPIPLALAASWDAELVEETAAIAADEATSTGIKWTFAPMLDIARDPRWGRIAEGNGEDPFLGSTLSAAYVRGFQGQDLADSERLLACAKHFVGYGAAQGGRDYENVELSTATLRDVYLPPFHTAVESGVASFMSAFNDLNGIPMSASHALLTEVLRSEWGFKGFVVSDWRAVIELVSHGIAASPADAAAKALFAGVDMDMLSNAFVEHLPGLVENGNLKLDKIDEAVRRVLRLKYLAGLFDNPYTDSQRHKTTLLKPEYRQAARRAAQRSIVLLKNNNILPLDIRFKRIAVVGPLVHARAELFGTWTPDGRPEDVTPLSQAFTEVAPKNFGLSFTEHADEAVRQAQHADLVIVVVGEHPNRSGENNNVAEISLPAGQRQLVESLAALGIPLVLVVLAGRPLAIPWEVRLADAVVYAWHPGIEGGRAIADILFGLAYPSGRLPVTLPRHTGQVPVYYAQKPSGRPVKSTDEFATRYNDLLTTPLFPFGFGLSYSRFVYDKLEISEPHMTGLNTISAEITNQGPFPGIETVQLYLRDCVASVTRPVKELKGFQQISLQPGETRRVSFHIKAGDLVFSDISGLPRVEPGDFQVWVGPNSASGLEGAYWLEV